MNNMKLGTETDRLHVLSVSSKVVLSAPPDAQQYDVQMWCCDALKLIPMLNMSEAVQLYYSMSQMR